MPTYDYHCARCDLTIEVAHRMSESPRLRCPMCTKVLKKAVSLVAIKPPVDMFWENENGGRGRYISQLQDTPGPEGSDPTAFCRSQSEIVEKAKRKGLVTERAR